MDTEHSGVDLVATRYSEMGDWIQWYHHHMSDVCNDKILGSRKSDPITVHFAIDFFDIARYLYPLSNALSRGIPSEAERTRLIDEFVARAHLLENPEGLGHRVLLAPYEDELHGLIDLVETHAIRFHRESSVAPIFGKMLDDFLRVDDADRLSSFVASVRDLIFVETGYYRSGLARLRGLLTSGRLRREREISSIRRHGLKSIEPANYWFRALVGIRGKRKLEAADRDAVAIETVIEWNREMASKGHVMALVSSAPSMVRLFSSKANISKMTVQLGDGSTFRAFKPLDYFECISRYTRAVGQDHGSTSRVSSLKELRSSISRAALALRIGRDIQLPGGIEEASMEDLSEQLSLLLDELDEQRASLEKHQLAENRMDELFGLLSRIATFESASIIRREKEYVASMFASEREDLSLREIIRSLRSNVLSLPSGMGTSILSSTDEVGDANLALLERYAGFPYWIDVSDPVLQSAMSALTDLVDAMPANIDDAVELVEVQIQNLVAASVEAENGRERRLVWALVFFVFERYRLTASILKAEIEDASAPHDKSLVSCKYMLGLVYLRERKVKDAIHFLTSALREEPGSVRIAHALAFAIGGSICGGDPWATTNTSLARAVELEDQAMSHLSDRPALAMSILNNYVYYGMEAIKQGEDVNKADIDNRLQELIERTIGWATPRPQWLHTCAAGRLWQAKRAKARRDTEVARRATADARRFCELGIQTRTYILSTQRELRSLLTEIGKLEQELA